MKKIISIAVVASFVFSLAIFSVMAQENESVIENKGVKANTGDQLEKILSPDLIKYFKNIEKRGTSLYGIKKDKMVEKKESINEKKVEKKTEQPEKKLEKIAHPDFIKLYEDIKKIGTALWGYKKENKEKTRHVVTAEESACVISAIEIKDDALIANNNSFADKLNSAITVRTDCQKTALGSTENQADNLDVCTKTFQESVETVREDTKKAHESIWNTYKESLKLCGQNSTTTTDTNVSADTTTSADDDASEETSTSTKETASNDVEIEIEDGGGSITDIASTEE